jgi:hypothetical protein
MHRAFESLYQSDGQGANRSLTFNNLIEELKSIRSNTMRTKNMEYECPTVPNESQARTINLLEQVS